MAPGRRKDANKPATRRSWKDGDVVLAKLKGYPAWPAIVNEHHKWGYPGSEKKVLVYFFGTEQIGFCSPGDIEEFTEEKKVSLLGKCHARGSDFIRALNEIIGCLEKQTKQDQANSDILTEETKENNSDESLTRSVDHKAPLVTAKRLSSGATDDLKSLTEAAVVAAAEDALHDEMQPEEVHSSDSRKLCVYSTSNGTDAVQSRNIGPQWRISARRVSSSSRVLLSSTNSNKRKISRRFSTKVQDKSMGRSTRIMKSSDDLEGCNGNSPPLVSNNSLQENDSKIMTVDSDSDSLNDGNSEDSGCKTVGDAPSVQNNEGEVELSDRLDFHGNATIVKKKRRPNRKRRRCHLAAKIDEVVSATEVVKTGCISLSGDNVEVAERCRNEDGDGHLPFLKRTRVRMSRLSPAGDEASNSTLKEKNLLEVPESSMVREADHITGNLDTSSKMDSSPARPPYWEIKKNLMDGEAALPPSKRLHRALEAMSANAAEHIQRASSCSLMVDTHTEGCSVKCSEPSMEKLPVIELSTGQAEDHNCCGSNMEGLEIDGNTAEVVINCGRSSPELCKNSLPCLNMSPAGCKVKALDFKKAANRSAAADISPVYPVSISIEETAGGSYNTEKCIHVGSSADGGNGLHKTNHLSLSEKNQDNHSGYREEKFISSSISNGHPEDRVVSVTQSSCATNRPESAAKEFPPSPSLRNITSSDRSVEKNNPCKNAQSHPRKAKLAGKSNSKWEPFPSFEATIRSLTRTKVSIGRATRIAIDCAKAGHANKVVELLARNLQIESSPPKKVNLFFLIDSIAQSSVGLKGNAGIYPSVIRPLLPLLLLAAAPPGTTYDENRKMCLKVLRVWLARKILPETLIRRHIRDLETLSGLHFTGGSRWACKFERPFDDPIREMEGMLVDEYGSNSSIQLPGFSIPAMRRGNGIGSDSDGESFEAVTPEHNSENLDGETTEKRSHILKDVDGELEMEDVAPTCDVEIISSSNTTGTDCKPMDTQLISAGLSRSPPLPPPSALPPPPPPPPSVLDSVSKVTQSKLLSSCQELKLNNKRSLSLRVKPRTSNAVHRSRYDSTDSETQLPRQMSYITDIRPFGEQPIHLPGRASSNFYPVHPPHAAPSNQFSFVAEQRIQLRRDFIPHHSHPNRFHTRCAEYANFHRDRDRNRFEQLDNIGEHWRPPLPSISGPYHLHAPMSYNGPPCEPAYPNNRWNFPPCSMNHRQFNPHTPPSEGPIPVTNRVPNFWKEREFV